MIVLTASTQELKFLMKTLIEEVIEYGLPEVTVEQYRAVCSVIETYAALREIKMYSSTFFDEYIAYIGQRFSDGKICLGYHRFQCRVIRMLSSLAETGNVDFSRATPGIRKYPVSADISTLIRIIYEENRISDGTRADLDAPMRHLFWYACNQGYTVETLDDIIIMKYLIEEVPVTNSGSTGRTLRCVKYITRYLKKHGVAKLNHNYEKLTLRNSQVKIIPAFSEEEILDMSSVIDTSTPIGMRDLAIILLGYGSGLRGIDIINMRLEDIDWHRQHVKILQSKTRQPLIVALNGEVLNAMADYILHARPECKTPEVFLSFFAPYKKLNGGFASMVDKYCERARVEKIPLRAFHSLRRSFETVLASKGVPIEAISQMVGHRSIEEDKPYITYDRKMAAFVAMGFSDVPITTGIYAGMDVLFSTAKGGGRP